MAPTFTLDSRVLGDWLHQAAVLQDTVRDGRPSRFGDFDTGRFHEVLEGFVDRLLEAGVIGTPAGWNLCVYMLDTDPGGPTCSR